MRASPCDIRSPGSQRGKFITDTTPAFQRQAGFTHLGEYVIHGIMDSAGNSTIDGGRGRLVSVCAGVRDYTACRYGTMLEGPEKFPVPVTSFLICLFNIRKNAGDTPVRIVEILVERFSVPVFQAVFLVPDVEGG